MSSNNDGKIHWPIEDGIDLNSADAFETLFSISVAELDITDYDEDGNSPAGDLYISLKDFAVVSETEFFRKKLIDLLIAGMDQRFDEQICFDDEFSERWTKEKSAGFHRLDRLRARLIRAYMEWEESDGKMTADELREKPLPAWKR